VKSTDPAAIRKHPSVVVSSFHRVSRINISGCIIGINAMSRLLVRASFVIPRCQKSIPSSRNDGHKHVLLSALMESLYMFAESFHLGS
jgi:hypothetical protein